MKKYLVAALAGIMSLGMVSTTQAFEVESIVSFTPGIFSGFTQIPASRFHIPLNNDLDLVVGGTLMFPYDTTGSEFGFSLLGGLNFETPGMGDLSVVAYLTKSTATGSDTDFGPIVVKKNFLFDVTNQLQLGVTVDLLSIGLDATAPTGKMIAILPHIEPVIAGTLRF